MRPPASPMVGLWWVVAPLVIATAAGAVGHLRAARPRNALAAEMETLSELQRRTLAELPARAIANATWLLGTVEAVRQMARFELDRLDPSDGATRGRTFVRFGIVDTNPDGQAALFNQACAADEHLCNEDLKRAAEREVALRIVPPGNRLPPYFLVGHPHLPPP